MMQEACAGTDYRVSTTAVNLPQTQWMMDRPRTQIQQKNVSDPSTGDGDDLSAPGAELQPVLSGTAPAGAYRTDAKGECTWVNEKWCELTGMSRDDALGNGWQRAIHPDDFFVVQLELAPSKICVAVRNHRASLKNPPKDVQQYLTTLEAQGLARTVLMLW